MPGCQLCFRLDWTAVVGLPLAVCAECGRRMRVSRACKVWTVRAQAVPLNLRNETDLVRDRDTRDSRLSKPWAVGRGLWGAWLDSLGGLGHTHSPRASGGVPGQTTPGPAIHSILWKHALVIVFVPADLWALPHGLRGLASPPQGSD